MMSLNTAYDSVVTMKLLFGFNLFINSRYGINRILAT